MGTVKAGRSLLTLCLACSLSDPLPSTQGTSVCHDAGGIPLAPGTSQGSQDLPASSSLLIASAQGLTEDGWDVGWQNEGDMKTCFPLHEPGKGGLSEGKEDREKPCHFPLNLVIQSSPVRGTVGSSASQRVRSIHARRGRACAHSSRQLLIVCPCALG